MKKAHSEWVVPFQNSDIDPERLALRLETPLLVRASQAAAVHKAQALAASGASGAASAALAATLQAAASSNNLSFAAGKLEVNFDHSLLRLMNEVRYWEKFNGAFAGSVRVLSFICLSCQQVLHVSLLFGRHQASTTCRT